MPLQDYSLLWGRVVDLNDEDRDEHPHYRCQVEYGHDRYCAVSINMASSARTAGTNDLRILVFDNVDIDELPSEVAAVAQGLADMCDAGYRHHHRGALLHRDEIPLAMRLDYVRGLQLDPEAFKTVPAAAAGPGNMLYDLLADWLEYAADRDNDVVAFFYGERWTNPGHANHIFARPFRPDVGVHDIHQNQGNPYLELKSKAFFENGVHQDGGFFLWDRNSDLWSVFFSCFSSQSWRTDPATGRPYDGPGIPDD